MTGTTPESIPGATAALPAAVAAEAAAAVAATPKWYTPLAGDADLMAHMVAKGYDKMEPLAAALAAVKGHRAAEKLVGLSADRVVKLDDFTATDTAAAAWQRLGVPADPKEYSFEGVKFGEDAELTTKFVDTFRASAAKNNIPKAAAEAFAADVFKTISDVSAADAAANAAFLIAEHAKLEAEWGSPDSEAFKGNMMIANRAATVLGITAEEVKGMSEAIGAARTSKLMRDLGMKLGEARYVSDPNNVDSGIMTKDSAKARMAELKTDAVWRDKLFKGDAGAKREWADLLKISTGA
jgi:hypothetical protein